MARDELAAVDGRALAVAPGLAVVGPFGAGGVPGEALQGSAQRGDQTFELPPLYQMGVAAAVLVGLGFTSVYAWRVAAEEERLNIALAAVQAVLAREQTLSALDSVLA